MKKLILGTSHRDVELMETPGLAVVEVSKEVINNIKRLSKAACCLEVDEITVFDYTPIWTTYADNEQTGEEVPGEPLKIDLSSLHVNKSRFWWECYIKHTDILIATDAVQLEKLADFETPEYLGSGEKVSIEYTRHYPNLNKIGIKIDD